MTQKQTRFGSLTLLIMDGENVKAELAWFNANGRAHHHDEWEICYVTNGSGRIFIAYQFGMAVADVKKGDVVKIPPLTDHWMEVESNQEMEILIVYTNRS